MAASASELVDRELDIEERALDVWLAADSGVKTIEQAIEALLPPPVAAAGRWRAALARRRKETGGSRKQRSGSTFEEFIEDFNAVLDTEGGSTWNEETQSWEEDKPPPAAGGAQLSDDEMSSRSQKAQNVLQRGIRSTLLQVHK